MNDTIINPLYSFVRRLQFHQISVLVFVQITDRTINTGNPGLSVLCQFMADRQVL